MDEKSKLSKIFSSRWLIISIVVVSVLLRLAAALALGDKVEDLPGTTDQISYNALAIRVMEGNGFSFDRAWWPATAAGAPTAHWSYLYTFFLVAVYSIFGIHPLAARIIQAILVGIAQPLLINWIGTVCVNNRIGKISALISSVYIYFIYYSATLMTEPFYITGILASVVVLIKISRQTTTIRENWSTYLVLGLAIGWTVLLRQLFLLVIPFLLVWLIWSRRKNNFWFVVKSLIISGIVVLILILPFTAYNYARFGKFVFLNTNSGFAFFWGNNPIYGNQFIPILPSETYQKLIPTELLGLDEASLDQELLKRGMEFVFDDPGRYILLSISRVPAYFQFWPTAESGLVSNISRVGSFGLFLPFMIIGLVLAVIKGYFKPFSSPLFLILIFVVVYCGMHLLTWALVRYRLPVDAFMIVFAGISFDWLIQLFEIRSKTRLALG